MKIKLPRQMLARMHSLFAFDEGGLPPEVSHPTTDGIPSQLHISPTPLRRVIKRGSPRVDGRFASRKMRASIPFESQNEFAFLVRAELDPNISQIYAQPTQLHLSVNGKERRDTADNAEVACIILVGALGSGKSTFLERYEKQLAPERKYGNLCRPVLYVSLQSSTTVAGVAKIMLEKMMGLPYCSGTQVDLTLRVKTQLVRQGVQLILFDEFHHVVETGGRKTLSKSADWIKELAKTTRTSVCMCGIPDVVKIVQANAQLDSITPYRFELGEYEYDAASDKLAFRQFLARLDAELPFNRRCGLGDADVALKLFMIAQGNLRTLMRIIREAGYIAIARSAPCIDMEDLAAAFEHHRSTIPVSENPFAFRGLL